MLDKFIQTEVIDVNSPEHDGMYRIMRAFVESPEIRRGEFEGHCFVIYKVTPDAFVLQEEYQAHGETMYVNKPVKVDRETLLNAMDNASRTQGISL